MCVFTDTMHNIKEEPAQYRSRAEINMYEHIAIDGDMFLQVSTAAIFSTCDVSNRCSLVPEVDVVAIFLPVHELHKRIIITKTKAGLFSTSSRASVNFLIRFKRRLKYQESRYRLLGFARYYLLSTVSFFERLEVLGINATPSACYCMSKANAEW